ncbi:hypothetical protein THASP1DRAFT_3428, partial [Thamnocephalis sphaerospora]
FPRGGGTGMTPLEYRSVMKQAERDLFSEHADAGANGAAAPKSTEGSDDDEDMDAQGAPGLVTGLTFKRLAVGTLLLGMISKINELSLVVTLPNHLVGQVAITEISEAITQRVEAAALEDDDDDEEEEDDDAGEQSDDEDANGTSAKQQRGLPDLQRMFRVGQWVRCAVVGLTGGDDADASTGGKKQRRQKKRIDLSLRVEHVNASVAALDLVAGLTMTAAVQSVEDHGYLLSIGMRDKSAFLMRKEAHAYEQKMNHGQPLQPGQLINVSLLEAAGANRVVRVTADPERVTRALLSEPLSNVNSLLPGELVSARITRVLPNGLACRVLEFFDAVVEVSHLPGMIAANERQLRSSFKVGDTISGRILYVSLSLAHKAIALTLLPHALAYEAPVVEGLPPAMNGVELGPRYGTILDQVTVRRADSGVGLLCELNALPGTYGYVHISRVSDKHLQSLSGTSGNWAIGTEHPARIVGYDPVDAMMQLSLQESVLSCPYLRVEDLPIGAIVKATVNKLTGTGMVVDLTDTPLTGFVPSMHLADVRLKQPEKKFKHGDKVTARVLNTDPNAKRVILTLKRTLVQSDLAPVCAFEEARVGEITHGFITAVRDYGCIVGLYGNLRVLCPTRELSETQVTDPHRLFNVGQSVRCRILSADPERQRIRVSFCTTPRANAGTSNTFSRDLSSIEVGQLVGARVTELRQDIVLLSLTGTEIRAALPVAHLSDHLDAVPRRLLAKIEVGQILEDLVVLTKNEQHANVLVSRKPLLVAAARAGQVCRSITDVREGDLVPGYVASVTKHGVFVDMLGGLCARAGKHNLSDQYVASPQEHFQQQQSVVCLVTKVDADENRVEIALKQAQLASATGIDLGSRQVQAPIDTTLKVVDDLKPGRATKARVDGIKPMQLNVMLADNLKGRVHVTNVYSRYEDIADPAHPFAGYKHPQTIDCQVIGWHGVRSHKSLAVTRKNTIADSVVELSLRPANATPSRAATGDFAANEEVLGFVADVHDKYLLVALSESVVGRVEAMAASSNAAVVAALGKHFQRGMAIKCRVLTVDAERKRIDLGVISGAQPPLLSFADVRVGMTVTGTVHTVNAEHGLALQLGKGLFGRVGLTDLSDNYAAKPTASYKKGQSVECAVVAVDADKKHITLSLRTSVVAQYRGDDSATEEVQDRVINSALDVNPGDVVRGYVRRVSDKGCFVSLGRGFDAMVKISELSDQFVKDWKSLVHVGQLVRGRVLGVDKLAEQVQMSLKRSSVSGKPQRLLGDFTVGEKVKATVKRVESYGAFLVPDNSQVSGLCHISEVSDSHVDDLTKVYSAGDRVKAVILNIDLDKKRIAFGLKASYFDDEDMVLDSEDDEDDDENESEDEEMEDAENSNASDEDAGSDSEDDEDGEDDDEDEEEEEESEVDSEGDGEDEEMADATPALQLGSGGFSWEAEDDLDAGIGAIEVPTSDSEADSDADKAQKKKGKKSKKQAAEMASDVTAELSSAAPTTAADFERLLLGSPNSSYLWINYVAFQLQMSELERARELAERALKTINFRETQERMNVWVAWLNLENRYGTAESLEATFHKALQTNEPKQVYLQLVRIYERSEKADLAEELYKTMTKKFNQSSKIWTQFGLFYLLQGKVDQSRKLLQRSLKSLPKRKHIKTISKFAQLEFKHGEPERGRTIFEGIVSNYPKRLDLWSVYLDMEVRAGDQDITRRLFQRITSLKFSSKKMKFLFKKWLSWEKSIGSVDGMEEVKQRALAFVQTA